MGFDLSMASRHRNGLRLLSGFRASILGFGTFSAFRVYFLGFDSSVASRSPHGFRLHSGFRALTMVSGASLAFRASVLGFGWYVAFSRGRGGLRWFFLHRVSSLGFER